MGLSRVAKLIESLERDPEHIQTYYGDLEAGIAWLLDATFEATDANEKARLAATEMRARLVLKWEAAVTFVTEADGARLT